MPRTSRDNVVRIATPDPVAAAAKATRDLRRRALIADFLATPVQADPAALTPLQRRIGETWPPHGGRRAREDDAG